MEGTAEKDLVTHSRKVAFRACRRRHHYAYELGVRAIKQSKPLLVGDALHRWLERWFANADATQGAMWLPPVAPMFGAGGELEAERWLRGDLMREVEAAFATVEADDPYEAAKLRAMVLAYHLRWRLQRWHVLAVESEFRAPLVNPLTNRTSQLYERGGKLDAIIGIDFEDGGPDYEGQWIVEHKSNKGPLDPESTYWLKLRLDPQCSDYFVGAQALGFRPRGIIYDVVCKPTTEPYKATPEEKREFTIGVGCSKCGGSGKAGAIVQGRGFYEVKFPGEDDKQIQCEGCNATGWKLGKDGQPQAPRLHKNVRLTDETPGEYGMRCFRVMLAEPDRYLHRHKVVRLEAEMREHLIDDWYTVKAIHEQKVTGAFPRNPDACFLFNRPCDYLAVCSRSASIDDPKLYQIARKHPELRVVTDA